MTEVAIVAMGAVVGPHRVASVSINKNAETAFALPCVLSSGDHECVSVARVSAVSFEE
jgi:hypothetical protein